ncbi:hypothetical protein [Streptomyces sp. PSKA30]|uniref:hypothetical protein n=1 Tax=Streptomyces sp. PSKA30 TaxID=2874597 RepID=UPI001CD12098|nr:hypothetical protein [Streptomyces sp. PSKA30]
MTKNNPLVVVDGDTTVDWAVKRPWGGFLAPEERLTAECSSHWLWGGAFLLTDLVGWALESLEGTLGSKNVRGVRHTGDCPAPDDERTHHSFSTLDKLPRDPKTGKPEKGAKLRVSAFIGFHRQPKLGRYPRDSIEGAPDLVIVKDSALGFSRAGGPWRDIAPLLVNQKRHGYPWILINLRLRKSSEADDLWNSLQGKARGLVVLTTVDSLRNVGADVSRGISWEKSSLDVIREIHGNPALASLRDCQRLIVTFGPSGALLIDKNNKQPYELLFDTEHTEGSWDREHSAGKMFGYSQVLTAAVASRIVSSKCTPAEAQSDSAGRFHDALCEGIGYGLRCMHRVFDQGFADPGDMPGELRFESACMKENEKEPEEGERPPAPRIGQSIIVDPRDSRAEDWSILDERYSSQDPLAEVAEVARSGKEHLTHVPIGRFEDFFSVDRRESEGLRSIQNLIAEYFDDSDKKKPRSIAAFGAPGDGKSFAVTQVARSLGAKEALTFNLSQFESPRDLIGALHQVRDSCLAGDVPLVFWDEFDTTLGSVDLGWLHFFLAPMQDGKFQEEQITHHVGRCIFVFAGGTSKNYEEFLAKASTFKNAKVVDFASRLRGYVDIVGVNPLQGSIVDLRVLARRAVLLDEFLRRAGIKEDKGGRKDVDDGVIEAFLTIQNYRNGTRSMEAIVDMSRLHKGGRFGNSSLPPETQLQLHVDASEFLRIARGQRPRSRFRWGAGRGR